MDDSAFKLGSCYLNALSTLLTSLTSYAGIQSNVTNNYLDFVGGTGRRTLPFAHLMALGGS